MLHSETPDAGSYAFAIVPDDDAREVFVRAYKACAVNEKRLCDLASAGGREKEFRELEKRARGRVKVSRRLILRDAFAVRDLVRHEDDDTRLLRTGALLSALANALAPRLRIADGFAGVSHGGYHLSSAPRESLWERPAYGSLPRKHDQVSSMLSVFHPGVDVTPEMLHGVKIERRTAGSIWLRALRERGELKIAVCPLTKDQPRIRSARMPAPSGKLPFLIDIPPNEDAQADHLLRILARCQTEAVAILVLPELRISPRLEGVIQGWLRAQTDDLGLLLVIAGSWHVEDGGRWVNRTRAFDHRGREIWRNDKLARYEVLPENVKKHPAYWKARGVGPAGAIEDIGAGDTLCVVDTSLGRMTSAICDGFFHKPVLRVMEDCGANFFFVPAMTDKTTDLKWAAEGVIRQRAATFVANCAHAAGSTAPSFIQAAAGRPSLIEADPRDEWLVHSWTI